eukprot:1326369-Amorphochlora_amoeboformis.AAC.1
MSRIYFLGLSWERIGVAKVFSSAQRCCQRGSTSEGGGAGDAKAFPLRRICDGGEMPRAIRDALAADRADLNIGERSRNTKNIVQARRIEVTARGAARKERWGRLSMRVAGAASSG